MYRERGFRTGSAKLYSDPKHRLYAGVGRVDKWGALIRWGPVRAWIGCRLSPHGKCRLKRTERRFRIPLDCLRGWPENCPSCHHQDSRATPPVLNNNNAALQYRQLVIDPRKRTWYNRRAW